MPSDDFFGDLFGTTSKKRSRARTFTPAQKLYHWENSAKKCHICLKRISKMSDAEFDHARAYSKGGATNGSNVRLAHRQCNRLKGDKSLSATRKVLGIKAPTSKKSAPKKSSRKKSARRRDDGGFNFFGL